ncbi:MAG: alpha/beta fold hydrolase [Deltaproteobacteria bacterium]|nr:alpha/beta fold hydrolase [Deltaproteobacteria bacterium]
MVGRSVVRAWVAAAQGGMMGRWGWLGVLSMVWACGSEDGDPAARFEDGACGHPILKEHRERFSVRCGLLSVPELRSDPEGPRATLPIAVIEPTTVSGLDNPPILYLEGGPGGTTWYFTLELAGDLVTQLDRAVILFEQRGAPLANPALECDRSLSRCRDFYRDRGIRVDGYSVLESAQDVCTLVDRLGFDQVALHGVSYGTLLAQEVMRRCPDRVSSAWIDGVLPADEPWSLELGPNFAASMERVFEVCGASEACRAAYPDPRGVFEELLETLPRGDGFDSVFTADQLVEFLFAGMYEPAFVEGVPGLLYAVRDGRVFEFLEAWYLGSPPRASRPRQLASSFAQGMYFAVSCNDDLQYLERPQLEATHASLHPVLRDHFLALLDQALAECETWPHHAREAKSPVTVAVPTLATSGGFDPITPPDGGERVAHHLPLGQFVQFGDASHGLLFDDCARKMWFAFLEDPLAPVGTRCAGERRVQFFVE